MPESAFALVRDADVPAGDAWLGPRERLVQERLTAVRRRADWRAGRWAARRALSALAAGDVSELEILAADDGAPEPWVAGIRLPLHVSLSHRDGVAAALATAADAVPGCDLELIETRPATFASDWLTHAELAAIAAVPDDEKDLAVTLIWSAKEAVLKVTRDGLRLDTREVEITLGDGTFEASTEAGRMSGWWRRDGSLVITAVAQETKL